jgi:alpha-galactosidase
MLRKGFASSSFGLFVFGNIFLSPLTLQAQVNGAGQRPYLGWSSFSEQTLHSSFLTQANIQMQSDALAASGLQKHGFKYINIDSGWMSTFDANGRPIPAAPGFPDIKALVDHIHANGQKVGIYWIPGIEQPAVDGNYPILNTPYTTQQIVTMPLARGNAFAGSPPNPFHDKIDFAKPGAQEYINSIVALFASWGIDFIKLDGVTPGSYSDDTSIDNRPDVVAWSKAIALSGKPIWLTVSWAIDSDYLSTWQQYSNARRIEDDVECEGRCSTLTNWNRIYQRFRDLPAWQNAASPSLGWNDLDSLDLCDGAMGGLTNDEKRTALSFWAMANAPMYLGGDVTKLDQFTKELLSNDEVLAISQSGHAAKQVLGGNQPVWVSNPGNNVYYVAIFNLDDVSTMVRIPWNLIGVFGAHSVRDLWDRADLGPSFGSYSTVLHGHSVRLLKISDMEPAPQMAATSYEAEAATLGGSASVSQCPSCSNGAKVGNLGLGTANTVTFNNVYVGRTGVYYMQVDSMTQGLRSYLYTVNGGDYNTLNSGGGSFLLPAGTVVPIYLQKGSNSIQFGNPVSYAPDLDRIVVRGDGNGFMPIPTSYEAEVATLSGSVAGVFSNYASGLAKAGNIGGTGNAVTFSNVKVPSSGIYQLQVDAATDGPRSFFLTINGATPLKLDLNGSTFDEPSNNVYSVSLRAGTNTLTFNNPTNVAPDLDRIVVAPYNQ